MHLKEALGSSVCGFGKKGDQYMTKCKMQLSEVVCARAPKAVVNAAMRQRSMLKQLSSLVPI